MPTPDCGLLVFVGVMTEQPVWRNGGFKHKYHIGVHKEQYTHIVSFIVYDGRKRTNCVHDKQ